MALVIHKMRRNRRHALVLAMATGLTIAPAFLANLIMRGQPVLISWNGGINIYAGNQPNFDPFSGNKAYAWRRVLQSPIDAGIEPEAARDRLYYRLALRQAARYPARAMATLATKAVALVSPVEYANNFRIYELRELSSVLEGDARTVRTAVDSAGDRRAVDPDRRRARAAAKPPAARQLDPMGHGRRAVDRRFPSLRRATALRSYSSARSGPRTRYRRRGPRGATGRRRALVFGRGGLPGDR